MWRSKGSVSFLSQCCSFGVATLRAATARIQHEQMLQERAEEELVNRHLRLEVETLKAPARIERVATGRLKMVVTPADSTVIERVAPAPAPPPSVVARRWSKRRSRWPKEPPTTGARRSSRGLRSPSRVARVVGRHRGRLIHLQVRYTDLTSRADRQQSRTIPSPAKRERS